MSTFMRVLGIMVIGLTLHTVVEASIAYAPREKLIHRMKR